MELSNRKIRFSGLFSFCLFLLIWPMFVGPIIAILNPSFFDGPEAMKTSFSSGLYSARNIAVGLAFLGAIYLRNAPMLFVLIFIRLILWRNKCLKYSFIFTAIWNSKIK